MKNYVAVETPQSSICNLDCVYCYIPKNKILKDINKYWKDDIQSGKHLELLKEEFGEELTNLSLWGGEPSLGFEDFKKLEDYFVTFPKLDFISTSSNFTVIEPHIFLLKNLQKISKKLNRKITYSLQISIDGDEETTNHNRGEDVYKRIIENIKKLNEVSYQVPDVNIFIQIKSTNTEDEYKKFAEHPEELEKYLDSFIFLQTTYEKGLRWPENMQIGLFTLPTLALPGSYTKEDGINYFLYHKTLENLKKTKYDFIQGDQYYFRLREILNVEKQINKYSSAETFSCSAGVSMLALDPDGTTHGCHSSFWYNYKEYLENSEELTDWAEGKRIVDFDPNKYWELTKPVISEYRDEYNKKRLSYTLSTYANNVSLRFDIAYSTIKILSEADQLNDIYKKDESMVKLFAAFIALKSTCWVHNQFLQGSLFPNNLSIYRMYGNGMFEYTVKKYGELF